MPRSGSCSHPTENKKNKNNLSRCIRATYGCAHRCWSGEHLPLGLLAIFLLIFFVIALPVCTFVAVQRLVRRRTQFGTDNDSASASESDDARMWQAFFPGDYKDHHFWVRASLSRGADCINCCTFGVRLFSYRNFVFFQVRHLSWAVLVILCAQKEYRQVQTRHFALDAPCWWWSWCVHASAAASPSQSYTFSHTGHDRRQCRDSCAHRCVHGGLAKAPPFPERAQVLLLGCALRLSARGYVVHPSRWSRSGRSAVEGLTRGLHGQSGGRSFLESRCWLARSVRKWSPSRSWCCPATGPVKPQRHSARSFLSASCCLSSRCQQRSSVSRFSMRVNEVHSAMCAPFALPLVTAHKVSTRTIGGESHLQRPRTADNRRQKVAARSSRRSTSCASRRGSAGGEEPHQR